MARKYTYLGQEKISYSKAIKNITGWTQKEFETQKRLMRYRVANFNKATGSKLSAIEELFYKVRFEDKQKYYASKGKETKELYPLQKALQDIKTTTSKKGLSPYQEKIAKDYIVETYKGLAKTYTRADKVYQRLLNGEITPAQANRRLSVMARQMRQLKDEQPTKWIELHQTEEIGTND